MELCDSQPLTNSYFLTRGMSPRWFLPLFCSLALLFAGCAPLGLTSGNGKSKHRNKVEAFFDDLGQSIKQTTRRLTGSGTRHRQPPSGSKSQNGLALKVLKSSLAPSKVHPGDRVKVVLQYRITGAPANGVEVQERSSLLFAGKELTVLKEDAATKENGEWENTLSFNVPPSAKSGKYSLKLRLNVLGICRTVQRSFSVVRK